MTRRLAVLGFSLLALTGCPRPAAPPATPPPRATPIPTPTPTPPPYVPLTRVDMGKIFNGMQYRVTLETEYGTTATEERNTPASYRAELVFKVKIPKPHQDLESISKLNSQLAELLPALPDMLKTAKVSPVFEELYRLKTNELKLGIDRLDRIPTQHNFFDCETLLELQHPVTKRRAIFIMADMDVDTDGSDVDRVPEIEGASSTFQPFTSYRWPKKTDKISPLIAFRETRIKELEAELGANPPAARRPQIEESIKSAKGEIGELNRFSFLIGHADPFIVLPGSMFGASRSGPFAPAVGDYCVVIHNGSIYPAIVGDVGPRARMGEASLRICKQILTKSHGAYRAVSDLKATYLVFPGTAEKPFASPDLQKWNAKCAKLLEEIGGHKGELFAWEDITKPKVPEVPPAPATPAAAAAPATP
jgi:hypothetical protein